MAAYNYKFKNGNEMWTEVVAYVTDLYNPRLGVYLFPYNESGSICIYYIDRDEALALIEKTKGTGEYWGCHLGPGGMIIDSNEYLEERGRDLPEVDAVDAFFEDAAKEDGWYDCFDEDLEKLLREEVE